MRDSGTSFGWDAYGITLLIWLPIFLFVTAFLRKKKMKVWKFRLAVSFLAAAGLAPSIFIIHASAIIVPAVTMLLVLEHMDSTALRWASVLGVVPISVTSFSIYAGWYLFFPRESRSKFQNQRLTARLIADDQ